MIWFPKVVVQRIFEKRFLKRNHYDNVCSVSTYRKTTTGVIRCAIWYHLYNLKNVKNTHGGVLLLVK